MLEMTFLAFQKTQCSLDSIPTKKEKEREGIREGEPQSEHHCATLLPHTEAGEQFDLSK